MTEKLVGFDDIGVGGNVQDYFVLNKYTAVASGNMTEFKVYSLANGNAKVALYADNSGEPGTLITAMNTGQAVTADQWNALTFTSTAITDETDYWLAFNIDTTGAVSYSGDTGSVRRYKSVAYSGFSFPNPAGTGFSGDTYDTCVAGWGTTGGAEYEIDTTTNLSVAAALLRGFDSDRGTSSNLSLTSSLARVLAIARATSSNLSLTTILSHVGGWIVSITSNLSLTTNISRAITYARAISSNLSLTAIISKIRGWIVATSTNLSLTTTISRAITWARATTSNLSLSVAISRIYGGLRAITVNLSLKPTVTVPTAIAITQEVSPLASKTATLQGKISDDGGLACEARFRWRKKV